MASQLAEKLNIPVIHFDKHFWEPGGFNRKRDKLIVFQEIRDLSKNQNWIMEGVFGELAEIALEEATLVLFLDKSWEECQEALFSRGSESSKQLDPAQAEESFRQLIEWAKQYWDRTDLRSQIGHRSLLEKAPCKKLIVKTRAEMKEIIQSFDLRQH